MKFLVTNVREDTDEGRSSFEANSIEEAKKIFKKDYVDKDEYAWDMMLLYHLVPCKCCGHEKEIVIDLARI